jgi:hypothetical protein
MIPKKPAPDASGNAIRGGYRFSEKIVLKQYYSESEPR